MRILIVEDDSRLLTQLDTLLQTNGYSVDLADDGAKALFLLSEHPYDLAIIDIGLPVMDGFEVIQKARKNSVTCPILILTTRPDFCSTFTRYLFLLWSTFNTRP